jgi:hypothetical protein
MGRLERYISLFVSIVCLGLGSFKFDRISVPAVVFRKAQPLNLNPSYIIFARRYARLTAEIFIGAKIRTRELSVRLLRAKLLTNALRRPTRLLKE